MIFGIIAGLLAAASQAVSYLFSRRFVIRHENGTVPLLVGSHMIMGGVSLVVLAAFHRIWIPCLSNAAVPVAVATVAYLAGQALIIPALRLTEASRVAPLLGLKVFIVALISASFMSQSFTGMQWTAVVLSVSAAFLLNRIGGALPIPSLLLVLGACVGYSFSDLAVRRVVLSFGETPLFLASILSVALCYSLAGLFAALVWPFFRCSRTQWKDAAPYSAAWLVGMIFLFACFGSIGVVFGNILQSGRGLISIGLGVLVAHFGSGVIEQRAEPALVLRRAAAAGLMIAAVALYYLT